MMQSMVTAFKGTMERMTASSEAPTPRSHYLSVFESTLKLMAPPLQERFIMQVLRMAQFLVSSTSLPAQKCALVDKIEEIIPNARTSLELYFPDDVQRAPPSNPRPSATPTSTPTPPSAIPYQPQQYQQYPFTMHQPSTSHHAPYQPTTSVPQVSPVITLSMPDTPILHTLSSATSVISPSSSELNTPHMRDPNY